MKRPRKKNRYFDLKSQKMLDKMMKERNVRASTATGYMSTIKMYTEFNQMQLYELIDEALKDVKEGTSISYGRSFITKRESKIATIPIGYADGIRRMLSNKGYVVIVRILYYSRND